MKLEWRGTKKEYVIRFTGSRGNVSEWRFRRMWLVNFGNAMFRSLLAGMVVVCAGAIGGIAARIELGLYPTEFTSLGQAIIILIFLTAASVIIFLEVARSLDWGREP